MRMIVVDDHAPFVGVLTHFLRRHPGIEVVGQACDILNGLRLVDELQPDLVLVDYSMPMMDGVIFTRLVKSKVQPPRVVVMSFIIDRRIQDDVLAAGADAFVDKDGLHGQIVQLLERMMQSAEPAGRDTTAPRRAFSPAGPHRP